MVDDHVLLDHAFYMGLYLAVLDRRNLAMVESGFYNTTTIPWDQETESIYSRRSDDYKSIDDFSIAHAMAQRIKQYDYNYFIVVISQHSWESQFSWELGEALLNCGALNVAEMTGHYSARFGNKTTVEGLYDKS